MNKNDILQIKTDLGICTDVLISNFICNFINKDFGIIFFCFCIVFETLCYFKKIKRY